MVSVLPVMFFVAVANVIIAVPLAVSTGFLNRNLHPYVFWISILTVTILIISAIIFYFCFLA
jgi:hypothetical protein